MKKSDNDIDNNPIAGFFTFLLCAAVVYFWWLIIFA